MQWVDALRIFYISKTNWNLRKNDNQIKKGKTVIGYKSFDEIQSDEHKSSKRFYFNNGRLQESVERLGANHAIILALMLVFLPYDSNDGYIEHCLLGLAWGTIMFSILYISDILVHNLKYQYFFYDLIINKKEKYLNRISLYLFISIIICGIYYCVKIVKRLNYIYLICFTCPILIVFIIFYYQKSQLDNELKNALNSFIIEQTTENKEKEKMIKEEEEFKDDENIETNKSQTGDQIIGALQKYD